MTTLLFLLTTIAVNLSRERVGHEPSRFVAVVGNWLIAEDAGKKVVQVDGRQWIKGQPSAGLAAKARILSGV